MPHRVVAFLTPPFLALLAAAFFLINVSPSPVAAYVCGQTGSAPETNSKLQIFVSGDRVEEIQWAFLITPNPFTLNGSLRVVDNQSIDLNRSLTDILLEDVCTTITGETYTVTLDAAPGPPCPLVANSLTRSAPQPTVPLSDPQTAAFYFVAKCLPTPTPSPTFTPTSTPGLLTPTPACPSLSTASACGSLTPTPTIPSLGIFISPAVIGCHGSAQVTVTLSGGGEADVVMSTTAGLITPGYSRTVGGVLIARLDLSDVDAGPYANVVTATTARGSASTSFTMTSCPGDDSPDGTPRAGGGTNGVLIVNQQQQQQQSGSGGGSNGSNGANGNNGANGANGSNGNNGANSSNGSSRISPPSTGNAGLFSPRSQE